MPRTDMPANTKQPRMMFAEDVYLPVTDTHVLDPAENVRLAGQNMRMLHRLARGPATNSELAQIALKYTSRIDNLRKAGCVITCERKSGGLCIYTLQEDETTRKILEGK